MFAQASVDIQGHTQASVFNYIVLFLKRYTINVVLIIYQVTVAVFFGVVELCFKNAYSAYIFTLKGAVWEIVIA